MSKQEIFWRHTLYQIARYGILMAGFFIMGFSGVMLVQSGLGASPWDVFHTGLTNILPITLGQASIGVGVLLIVVASIMGVRPYTGTILNMIFIGLFMDLTIYWNVFPAIPESLAMKIVYLCVGCFVNAIGQAIYFSANLKYGPRDSLMIGIKKHTGLSVKWAKTIIEIAAVIGGWLLGGVFGIGTIVFALCTGTFLALGLSWTQKFKDSRFFKDFCDRFYYCGQEHKLKESDSQVAQRKDGR